MVNERNVQSALDAAKLKKLPPVEPYFDKVYQATYSARWAGYANGFAMGGGVGAVIGAAAAFIPAAFGIGPAPGLALIGQSTALFASLGAATGAVICREAGFSAGAVAAGFEEYERRQKLEKIRAQNPALAQAVEEAVEERAQAERPQSRFGQFAELASRIANWPLVGIGLAIGAACGAVFGLSPLTDFVMQQNGSFFPLHPEAGMAGKVIMSAGIGALVGGAFLGFSGALVSNTLHNADRRILNGEIFKAKTPASELVQTVEEAIGALDKPRQGQVANPHCTVIDWQGAQQGKSLRP